MNTRYGNLKRCLLKPKFLKTNSINHNFLFGAVAEFVDNARDADAKNLHIFIEKSPLRGGFIFCVKDDGKGMDPYESSMLINFGQSDKEMQNSCDKQLIGCYGNGLKSGSLRIGNDVMLLTKRDGILTAILISQTFYDQENIDEVIVPMPSFYANTKLPWFDDSLSDNLQDLIDIHETEMDIIFKYSPFKNLNEFFKFANKLDTDSGTIVIVYNLNLRNDGLTEFDIDADTTDIIMRDFRVTYQRGSQPEHQSLRKYLSILYFNPSMKIYVRDNLVRTRILARELSMTRMYTYQGRLTSFKNNIIKKQDQLEKRITLEQNKQREIESKIADLRNRKNTERIENFDKKLAKLVQSKENSVSTVQQIQKSVEFLKREARRPKSLEFIFGLNINMRDSDGIFIYNSNRLVIMYEHTKRQLKNYRECRGIVTVVNVPYSILMPQANKQELADNYEQSQLIKAIGECTEQYLSDLKILLQLESIQTTFWNDFGYFSESNDLPSEQIDYKRRRLRHVRPVLQCDECGKWRMLRYQHGLEDLNLDEPWTCSLNTDGTKNSCDIPEDLGEFTKCEFRGLNISNNSQAEGKIYKFKKEERKSVMQGNGESSKISQENGASSRKSFEKSQNDFYSSLKKISINAEKKPLNDSVQIQSQSSTHATMKSRQIELEPSKTSEKSSQVATNSKANNKSIRKSMDGLPDIDQITSPNRLLHDISMENSLNDDNDDKEEEMEEDEENEKEEETIVMKKPDNKPISNKNPTNVKKSKSNAKRVANRVVRNEKRARLSTSIVATTSDEEDDNDQLADINNNNIKSKNTSSNKTRANKDKNLSSDGNTLPTYMEIGGSDELTRANEFEDLNHTTAANNSSNLLADQTEPVFTFVNANDTNSDDDDIIDLTEDLLLRNKPTQVAQIEKSRRRTSVNLINASTLSVDNIKAEQELAHSFIQPNTSIFQLSNESDQNEFQNRFRTSLILMASFSRKTEEDKNKIKEMSERELRELNMEDFFEKVKQILMKKINDKCEETKLKTKEKTLASTQRKVINSLRQTGKQQFTLDEILKAFQAAKEPIQLN